MKRRALAAVLFAAALAVEGAALAADPVAQAKTYYDAGVRAYAAAQYTVAIEAFSEAYRLAARESVLFSLAQAERRQYTVEHNAKHLHDAIAHFRRYLEVVPEGGRRADAVEALGELEAVAARLAPPPAQEPAAPAAPAAPAPQVQAPARIMVTVLTKEATILLDGKEHKDETIIEEVTPGPHTVRVSAAGYLDEQREVRAVSGSLVPLEVTLREQPSFFQVSAPAGARVLMDGQPLGEAPLPRDVEVSSGAHLVTVTRTGYVPYHRSLSIERGQTMPLSISLPRTRQRAIAFGVLGASVGTLLTGIAFGLGAWQAEAGSRGILDNNKTRNLTTAELESYNDGLELRDNLRIASLVGFGVTAVLALGGAGLYFFDNPVPVASEPSSRAPATRPSSTKVSVAAAPGALSIAVTGSF